MMMKPVLLFPAISLVLTATSASAAVYNFSVVSTVQTGGGSYVPNFQFDIDDAAVLFDSHPYGFDVNSVATTGQRPSLGIPAGNVNYTSNYTFFIGPDGGFSDYGGTYSPHSFYGAPLFTGPNNAPQFKTGVFSLYLSSVYTSLTPADAVLTITGPAVPTGPTNPTGPTGAVPEPATWAMMLFGFGLVGGAMRGRVKGRRPTYA